MKRPLGFFIWAFLGALLLVGGLFVPAHFFAIDVKVIELAGKGTDSLIDFAADELKNGKIGATKLLARTSEKLGLPEAGQLESTLAKVITALTNSPAPTESALAGLTNNLRSTDSKPIIDLLMARTTREKTLSFLQGSTRPGIHQIIRTRTLTNTVHFPPALSAAGQPLDSVITLAALFSATERFSPSLRDSIETMAFEANHGGSFQPLESLYLDLLSLGKRFDGAQLAELLQTIEKPAILHGVAETGRTVADENIPVVYSAILFSADPRAVSAYLTKFPTEGLVDLSAAIVRGKGALQELLVRQRRIYSPAWRLALAGYDPFGAFYYRMLPFCRSSPTLAVLLRVTLFALGAFWLGHAFGNLTFVGKTEPAGHLDGTRLAQETVLAVCFFSVLILSAEPFITSETPKLPPPVRLRTPGTGRAFVSKTPKPVHPIMSLSTLTPLLIFFVLQALLYIWSLAKLAEIRQQSVGARLKLRLLENEEHLFDAGLYLGFAGTVISLILVSFGIISQSIMAAYSSTSFGIIFVSILKICHIRPLRRKLIIESEAQS